MNIIKKGLSFIAKKLQKYVTNDSKKNKNINLKNKKDIELENNKINNSKNTKKKYITSNKNINNEKEYNKASQINQKQINKNMPKHTFEKDITKTKNTQTIINTNQLKTIWDLLKIKENTQAEYLIKVIPSDDWVTMDEIKKRIKLEFNIEYKNAKSLYPYLKTLTDINLIKINNTGRKRSWKKNIIILE